MWFPNGKSHGRPIFLDEKTTESSDLDQPQSTSPVSAVLRALGIMAIASIILLGLLFGIGCAIGAAHSLNHSAFASQIFLASSAKNELPSHIIPRAVGWTWWNGQQFGAWLALSAAAFGAAQQMEAGAASWASGVGGALCLLIAIAGGAFETAKRSVEGHVMLPIKGGHMGLQPVNLHLSHNWTSLPTNMAWHKVMDNNTHDTFLASDGLGGHHGIVSLSSSSPAISMNTTTKRNSNEESHYFDNSHGDYVYTYLEGGNSAREYYYDHSVADWVNYMPGVVYWNVNFQGSDWYQQLCMVPQDSQGNAVASISVQTNMNSYNTGLECMYEAEDSNPSFAPN